MAGTVVLSDELNQLITFFEIQPADLALILQTDFVTLGGWLADNKTYPEGATREALEQFILLARRLSELFGSQEGIMRWVWGENGYLGGLAPIECLLEGRIDLAHSALDALEAGIFI